MALALKTTSSPDLSVKSAVRESSAAMLLMCPNRMPDWVAPEPKEKLCMSPLLMLRPLMTMLWTRARVSRERSASAIVIPET